ncbi:MAG: ComF family protein [Dissulfurispiraceae bacterium]|jgi:ComF family protein
MTHNLVNRFLNLLFPSSCPVCGNDSDSHRHNPVCISCWKGIERYSGPACVTCGIPIVSAHAAHCESCLKTPPSFSKIIYYGIYDGALRKAVHLLKFKGIKRLARPIAELLSELPIPEAEGIVPVPLHPARLREREFNQTALISRHLSRHYGIPLLLDVLKKDRKTPPQTDVSGKERLKNVRNAFIADKAADGLRLILVDDVITTGATVYECARVLTKAGAADVTVVALARSIIDRSY